MSAFNGDNIGSPSKDLVLNTHSKIYIKFGSRYIEIDPIKLEKLLNSIELLINRVIINNFFTYLFGK